MVYVISHTGKTIMPTQRHGKVRRLLRDGLASVVEREPFTIRLDYENTEFIQPVTLGVDAGTKHIGLCATTEKKELFAAEMRLRTDIVKLLSQRKEARRSRRSSKTRYRKPRFDNRRHRAFTPSVEQRIQSHLHLIKKINGILPVARTVIEVAQFDTQLLKNPGIQGEQYQQGPQMSFWNLREYILARDGHVCQCCKGRTKDPVLNIHHIESRQTGGDSPDNLVTLCETCHDAYHKRKTDFKPERGSKFLRDAAVMSIMRWELYNRAKSIWNNVHLTYGYMTKHTRISNGLGKSHAVDARCISGHPLAKACTERWQMRQVANHTRSLHVQNMTKGGKRRSTIAPHFIGKTRLQRYDKVLWNGIRCFITGSTNGRPILRNIDWSLTTPTASINAKTVTFLSRKRGGYILQTI